MTGNKTISRPPFWASLFTILGVVILCILGTWQLQRLEWKTNIIKTLEAEYNKDVFSTYLTTQDFTPLSNLKRGRVIGIFAHDHEIPLGVRTHKGKPGYHIFTPLIMETGETLLVNRGWVPQKLKDPSSRPKSLRLGQIEITGLIRTPERPNMFTPENDPKKNNWYQLNLNEIALERGITDLLPITLYADSSPNDTIYPIAAASTPHINNNHFQYACFWFAMAGVLIIIYLLRFVIKEKSN